MTVGSTRVFTIALATMADSASATTLLPEAVLDRLNRQEGGNDARGLRDAEPSSLSGSLSSPSP